VGEVFWKRDAFKEYGMYVLRFFKDSYIIYVIIDDKLPVKRKDKRLIFGRSKDPNELWVPLIEKAYAKLHGSYKSLIGGFVHNGLADLTGYSPRLIVMKEGYVGFSKKYDKEEIWGILQQYIDWGCLLGCSIQANPKDKEKKDKVEGDEGQGLLSGHAYSLLSMGIIKAEGEDAKKKGEKEIRLIKIRNPWGRGEWEGEFGDESKEREQYESQINIVFNEKQRAQERVGIDNNDGTFFMRFDDWFNKFTSVFAAIKFPLHWAGKRIQGKWSGEQGGNRDQGTWISNPQIKFKLEKEDGMSGDDVFREVFIGLYIKDTRLSMGAEYFKVSAVQLLSHCSFYLFIPS
jgi:calpain